MNKIFDIPMLLQILGCVPEFLFELRDVLITRHMFKCKISYL